MEKSAAYDASSLDWGALRSLAERAAQETPLKPAPKLSYFNPVTGENVEVLGPHWALDHLQRSVEEVAPLAVDEEYSDTVCALLPDGELVQVQVIQGTFTAGALTDYTSHHSVEKMSDSDIESLDFTKVQTPKIDEYHETGSAKARGWGDQGRGPLVWGSNLAHRSRGAGLSLLLKDVLAGHQASLPDPVSLHTEAGSGKCFRGSDEAERLQAQQASASAAALRRRRDSLAALAAAFLAVTVLVPFLIGHFLLTKTFVLRPDPRVYDEQARGMGDHFLATYLAGLVPIALVLGIFLVARRPWQNRMISVVCGWALVIGSVAVLLPAAMSKWHEAEQTTIAKLRETPFPFSDRYFDCASWSISAENGAQQPELWQVHLGRTKGTNVDGCNHVSVYRGWQYVGSFGLPAGDIFTRAITVNHVGWDSPYHVEGSSDIASMNRVTGAPRPMNPMATNVDLPTKNGRVLVFNLDGAGAGGFELR